MTTQRNGQRTSVVLLAAMAATLVLGCALTDKNSPIVPRYFSPERPVDGARSTPRAAGAVGELRMGHIGSAANLDERLVYRDSAYEVGYYSERRWTEAPEEYLKRQLAGALFEERSLRRVVGGPAPTLEVDLVAFEEVRVPTRLARVQVNVRLHDQHLVRWEQTLTVEQPEIVARGGDHADEMVQALGVALRAVVERIADRVVTELAAVPAPAGAATAAKSGSRE
jgi:cholesterol transport system auxiliary component